MGSSINTQVVSISSQDPNTDANAIIYAFSKTNFTREDQSNESIALMGEELGTFLIIKGRPTLITAQVLVVSSDTIQTVQSSNSLARLFFCQRLVPTDDRTMIITLELPGSSRIILTTSFVMDSALGREALVKLIGIHSEDRMSTPINEHDENGKAIMTPEIETQFDAQPRLPEFPTLDVSLLSTNERFEEYPVNSPTAIPFETDLFVGKMMLILRPEDPTTDPYWNERLFSKRKRRFVFQLQGKFKRLPRGIVYAGAEISDPMKIGLVAKGMCSILLNLVRSFNSNMHFSFGDKRNEEESHIVIPAWTFFELLVVTKSGDTPPPMGEDFPESQKSKEERKTSNSVGNWNTEDTYSMSYYSMYIDLPTWKVVKVPVAPDIDLRTFWNKSFLKIVLYENQAHLNDKRHLTKDNSYFFALKIQFHPDGKKQETEESLPWKLRRRLNSESNLSLLEESEPNLRFNIEDNPSGEPAILEESDGEEFFFDAAESQDSVISPFPISNHRMVPSVEPQLVGLAMLDTICPLSIDICSKGKCATVYVFISPNGKSLFRTASIVAEYFNLDVARKSVENTWSPRLANSEKSRRILGQAYVTARESGMSQVATKLLAFHQLETEFDIKFLQRTSPNIMSKPSKVIRKSCFVARALSDYHWVEEWASITEHQIVFYHPERQKDNYRMSLSSIVKVEKLSAEESPNLPSYSFMAIETLGRTIYLMFASEQECCAWVGILQDLRILKCNSHPNSSGLEGSKVSSMSEHLMSIDDPAEEFLHKSSMWNCKQRRILNCRTFCFRPSGQDPVKSVQDTLRQALEPQEDSEEANLKAFLTCTSLLKGVHVNGLGEMERLAFFLNLYHVMIMHAFLVLGPPDSSFQWISYFNTISYQCSDEIFSLSELEHNIVRASMNYPSNFVSKFVLPKSQFQFALRQSDYRINFALDCGSVSNPGKVPIYTTEQLDKQLDTACSNYLALFATVTAKRCYTILTLPRICQWFADDFGSNIQMIQQVQKFLKEAEHKAIQASWSKQEKRFTDLTIKYLPYSFECRHLTLLDDRPQFTSE